jgi:ethanolamine-phosphate cytidylyltransferase
MCVFLCVFLLTCEQAKQRVTELEEKLAKLEHPSQSDHSGEIRIWMDGAFDVMHYGHMNAFRQGRSLGTYLIVGVNR